MVMKETGGSAGQRTTPAMTRRLDSKADGQKTKAEAEWRWVSRRERRAVARSSSSSRESKRAKRPRLCLWGVSGRWWAAAAAVESRVMVLGGDAAEGDVTLAAWRTGRVELRGATPGGDAHYKRRGRRRKEEEEE